MPGEEALRFNIFAKDEFSKSFDKLTSKLPSVKTAALAAAGGVAALGTALFAMAKTTATAYDKLGKFSDQTGLSTEFLSKMGVAANFADVNVKTMNKSLERLQIGIGEAGKGIGLAKDTLKDMGIELTQANGQMHTAESILPLLADKFQGMTSATERTEMAQKLFGQRGTEMIKILKDGSEGLKDYADEAEAMGLVVSEQAAANAGKFNDALFKVTGTLTGLKNEIGERVMPYITALAEKFSNFVRKNREGIMNFGAEILRFIGNIMDNTAKGIAYIIDFWNSIKAGWLEVKIMFSDLSVAYDDMIRAIVVKYSEFLQTINKRGIFDDAIREAEGFLWATGNGYDAMSMMGKEAQKQLNTLLGEGLAIDKVDEFTLKVRGAIEEIRIAGEAEIEATAEKNEILLEQHDAHIQGWLASEEERVAKEKEFNEKAAANKATAIKKMIAVGSALGKEMFVVSKAVAIADATMNTYAAVASAIKNPPGPPWSFIYGAAALAYGMAQVASISSTKYAAHGGMTNVPSEQTMLLDKGERILSPNQNKDFTDFISGEGGAGGGVVIENINILPNATNAEMLLNMRQDDWEEIVENNIRPALNTLNDRGFAVA